VKTSTETPASASASQHGLADLLADLVVSARAEQLGDDRRHGQQDAINPTKTLK
jgi:hypothetical protein